MRQIICTFTIANHFMTFLLGTIPVQYVLHSKNFISDRTMAKVDWITNSMAENGLYGFYSSAAQFSLNSRVNRRHIGGFNDDEISPLAMQQFKRVMIFILCFNALAMIAFVTETLVFKWIMWRNRKYPVDSVQYLKRNNHFTWSFRIYLSTWGQYRYYLPQNQMGNQKAANVPQHKIIKSKQGQKLVLTSNSFICMVFDLQYFTD